MAEQESKWQGLTVLPVHPIRPSPTLFSRPFGGIPRRMDQRWRTHIIGSLLRTPARFPASCDNASGNTWTISGEEILPSSPDLDGILAHIARYPHLTCIQSGDLVSGGHAVTEGQINDLEEDEGDGENPE